jgi:phosphotransferase system enzyme I (PtsI)
VIVCGEMASTPAYAVLLIGLGATDLSMTPSSIPRVRRAIAGIHSHDARLIAEACLKSDTADDVENLVRERFTKLWPSLFASASLPARRQAK